MSERLERMFKKKCDEVVLLTDKIEKLEYENKQLQESINGWVTYYEELIELQEENKRLQKALRDIGANTTDEAASEVVVKTLWGDSE